MVQEPYAPNIAPNLRWTVLSHSVQLEKRLSSSWKKLHMEGLDDMKEVKSSYYLLKTKLYMLGEKNVLAA